MNPIISTAINSSRLHKDQTDKLLQYRNTTSIESQIHTSNNKNEFYITPPSIPKSLFIRRQNYVHLPPNSGSLTERNHKKDNSINLSNMYIVEDNKINSARLLHNKVKVSNKSKLNTMSSSELNDIDLDSVTYDLPKENIKNDDIFNLSPNSDNFTINNKKLNFNKFALSMQFQVHELFPDLEKIIKADPKLETCNIAFNLLESLLLSITNPTITSITQRLFPIIKHSLYSPVPSYQQQNLNDFKVSSRLPYFCIVNDLQGVTYCIDL